MRPALPPQHMFAAALLDPSLPTPAGLCAGNGSDPGLRFAVYRNNVVHSLVTVLGDTFPVVRQLVGEDFFGAMARRFVTEHPPTSPLMHRYGSGFPDWVADFEPATDLPYLSDLARLERARLRAFHAADEAPLDAQVLVAVLQAPERLAVSSLILHPSLAVVPSPHPVVSLWSAHQQDDAARDEQLGQLRLDTGESALVFRVDDDALVLGLPAADAALAAELAGGAPLGAAQASHPQADLVRLLSLLLRHGQVIGVISALGDSPVSGQVNAHHTLNRTPHSAQETAP
ncbi:MAG: DUF2063 domain-containing protein [Leptothrix sp. (in: Bacteria)]|nr:DUF2063 domain-containing protein [Leptothrix sp. (in: b-proteobacteria)]